MQIQFKSYKEIGKDAAEYALDEFEYRSKSIRQWIDELATLETKWDKLYRWLNDFHYGIAPDESIPDDEYHDRTIIADVLDDVMEQMTKLEEKERTNDEC